MISAVLHKEIALLVSVPADQPRIVSEKMISEHLQLVAQWIAAYNNETMLQLRGTTSTVQPGIESIPITYAQAKELEGFITLLDLPDRVLCYDDVVVNGWEVYNEAHLVRANQWESSFLNALERNDFHKLQSLIHELAEIEFQYGRITIQASTPLLYHMLNKIRIVFDCMRPFAGPHVMEVFETAPRILYRKSIREIMDSVDMIFSYFFDSLEHTEQKRLPIWLSRMDAYIVENFDNPDLNVSTISDYFDLCPAYAGRLYKTHFGFSVLDRINHLRIERATSLMEQNILLKDIAVIVGYENRHRMNRAFVKYAGFTPAEAKEGLLNAKTESKENH